MNDIIGRKRKQLNTQVVEQYLDCQQLIYPAREYLKIISKINYFNMGNNIL